MKNKQIKEVFKKGKLKDTPYLRVYFLLDGDSEVPVEAACIVSKKVSGSAVQRHKYQRWMRELVKEQKDSLPDGMKLVLVAKARMNDVGGFGELREKVGMLEKHETQITKPKQNIKHKHN